LINACDQVAVDIGSEVLRHVPGRISTEVDARFAWLQLFGSANALPGGGELN
jgi:hypothetical protein